MQLACSAQQLAATHAPQSPARAGHIEGGCVQMKSAQVPEQHEADCEHLAPLGAHWLNVPQIPLEHPLLQQSE